MESFKDLELPAFLHESLRKMKFDKPTPIQADAIPKALEGKDIIASAETGSGKTAAFGIPLLAYLDKNRNSSALILAPTRELADQVRGVLTQLSGGRYDLSSALLIGGMGMGAQVDSLKRGCRLIIGTPGRINDHLQQKTLNLSKTGFLVLDEADRMLDMGFAPQLDRIRKYLTAPRQTVLFSATIPPDIQAMASHYLKDPVRITVGVTSKPVENVHQTILYTSQGRKMDELVEELRTREGSVLIFARTQHRVDRLAKSLKEKNFTNARIHGGRTQGQRRISLDQFKRGQVRILVATDIAARGLDINHIGHVVNFDLPQVAEDYVHRVGRTARAGAKGDALSFLTPDDRNLWRDILRTLGSASSNVTTLPSHFKDHNTPLAKPAGFLTSSYPSAPKNSGNQRQGHHKQAPHGRSSSHVSSGAPSGPHHPSGSKTGRPHSPSDSHKPWDRKPQGPRPAGSHPAGPHPGNRNERSSFGDRRDSSRPGENRNRDSFNRSRPAQGDNRSANRTGYRSDRSERSGNSAPSSKVKGWFKKMF
jgi:superfamily II DNA/RNA helicase